AIEAKDMYVEKEEKQDKVPGVVTKEREIHGVKVSHIEIEQKGEKALHKKAGSYITIFADGVKKQDTKTQARAAKVLAKEIQGLLDKHNIPDTKKGLIVGLGNWNVTPDALGPMTVDKTM